MSGVPMVTVLIPARNEERDIDRCLEAVLDQDHPHDRMEVVLVDGGSADRTVDVATRLLEAGDTSWKIIHNPVGTTPSNLNAGLRAARGEILCRVDARSIVPRHYVSLCAEVLTERSGLAVVGGAQVAVAVDDSVTSVGIARALNNRYAMGGSRYRSGAGSGATETVYLGAFRTGQLQSAGGWDEYFDTNQDFELNSRMRRLGAVWFDERLSVGYVPRQQLSALWQQYFRFGRWKVRYWRRTGDPPQRRQVLPLVAPFAAIVSLRPARRVLSLRRLVLLAVSAVLVVDGAGGAVPAPLRVRLVSGAATVVVVTAWVGGVYTEALRRRP